MNPAHTVTSASTVNPLTGGTFPRSRPERPVYLVTVKKNDPMARRSRDVSRRGAGRVPAQETLAQERRPRDEDREAVYSCGQYTEHFNALIKKTPKPNRHFAMLVRERMRLEGVPMDQATYNLLLEKVVDLRDPAAFDIFDEFEEEASRDDSAVRPDLTTLRLMVRACERNGEYSRAFHIYAGMKEAYGVFPDVPLYNTLIGYCAPLKDETTASYLVEEMRDRNAEPDVHTYNSLMNVFADAPYELILLTFEDMVKRRLKPNRRTFNTLMKACQRIGDYDRVFQFFEELKREGLTPDVVTYNILIIACRDRLDYVLGTGPHAHVRRTNEQKDMGVKAVAQLSMSLLAEMEELSIDPNTFTYNALFAVLSRCGDKRMFELFAQMKEDEGRHEQKVPEQDAAPIELQPTTVPPSFAELRDMLDKDASRHQEDDGQSDRIGAHGVRPNVETYTTLIQGAARIKAPEEAYQLYGEMKDRGITPDHGIFLKLLDVCSIQADKRRGFGLLEEAKLHGVTVDTALYNALINVLAESCDPEVWDVLEEVRQDKQQLSLRPNQDTFNLMLKAALKQHDLPAALRLYEEMCEPRCPVKPDTVSYSLLMDNCAAHRDVREASSLILDMKRRNVAPTITTYSRLMNVYVEAGDAGVVEVFDDIKRHGPAPNLEAYTTLLEFYRRTQDEAIVGLFDEMKKAGVEPDLAAYNVMLQFAAASGSQQRSFKYLEELKMRGLNADVATYNALLAVFAPTGSDFIFKVFEEMAECRVAPDRDTLGILMKHKEGRAALSKAAQHQLIKVDPALLA